MTAKGDKRKGTKSLIEHNDVTIVGSGIVGQTLALALADTGLSIHIVDTQESLHREAADDFSPRVSAISAASQTAFENLGVWPRILRKQVYKQMEVWEQDSFGSIAFGHQEMGLNALGHIIENDQLSSALYLAAKSHASIHYSLGEEITHISFAEDEYQLKLASGRMLTTKLLVGADGGNSFVRTQLGFKLSFWDYDHTAIVANVRTQKPHNETARQAFMPSGPLAFLPLPDPEETLCSIVWSQKSQQAKALLKLDDKAFCKALAVALDMRLGPCELVSKRFSYPLRMRYARQWVDHNAALIGDAAHTIHPLAGQGANLGITDALALAANIRQSLDANKPFYAKQQLRKYERKQKANAQKVIASMEGFKQLFDGSNPAKKLIRTSGLLAANNIKPIKAFFMAQAQGN